jgi:Zn-dependent protease
MLRSWRLGSAFGIGIFVHWSFLLLPLVVVLLSSQDGGGSFVAFSLVVTLSIFFCVVLHELGHALMARYFGIGTRDITLYPIGGVARLERMSERPWEEVCIAIAGPAVNVLLAVLVLAVYSLNFVLPAKEELMEMQRLLVGGGLPWKETVQLFLLNLGFLNLFLCAFNMIPAFPMDGGRVLRAVLAPVLGRLAATEIAALLGMLISGVMVLCGLRILDLPLFQSPFLVLVGLFVMFAGQQELYAVRQREAQRRGLVPVGMGPGPFMNVTVGPPEPNFSGFTWDRDHHCWIEWRGGKPVHACFVAAE